MSRFLRDQKGAVTIEFTVLVPIFVLLLVFFADAAVIYMTHSEMFKVARDTARRMSTGQLETASEVEAHAAQHLFLGQRTYTVLANFGGVKRVTVRVPVGEAAIFGAWFKPVLGRTLEASAAMRGEPRLVEEN